MRINWKQRERIATVASVFGWTKTNRRQIRDKIRFHNILSTTPRPRLPMKKYENRISVAFCFNDNGYKQACVSIKRWLWHQKIGVITTYIALLMTGCRPPIVAQYQK